MTPFRKVKTIQKKYFWPSAGFAGVLLGGTGLVVVAVALFVVVPQYIYRMEGW